MTVPSTYLQMFSTLNESGELRLELIEKPVPTPKANEVLVRIEATPINPSDQGVMMATMNSPGRGPISARRARLAKAVVLC